MANSVDPDEMVHSTPFAKVPASVCREERVKIRLTTKTCLYSFDPLKPQFYIVKLGGLQGFTLFFLFLLKT